MRGYRNLSFYDFRAYEGGDVDIETSLREYGLAWKQIKKDTYKFIFGVGAAKDEFGNLVYSRFDWSILTKADYIDMLNSEWFDREAVEKFCGHDIGEFQPSNVSDAIAYYGTDNILGSSHYSFTIGRI